jgi:hypothetical protein
MRIKQEYKVREIAGESVVIMQGKQGADLTQIITLNDSALMLWNALQGKDFEAGDAAEVLMQNYEVAAEVALRDATAWVERLSECGLIE